MCRNIILSSTTSYYYYTLPGFALNAYDAREAAEATCSTWISSLRGLDVLCGRADRLVTASGSELCQRPPVAASGVCRPNLKDPGNCEIPNLPEPLAAVNF